MSLNRFNDVIVMPSEMINLLPWESENDRLVDFLFIHIPEEFFYADKP